MNIDGVTQQGTGHPAVFTQLGSSCPHPQLPSAASGLSAANAFPFGSHFLVPWSHITKIKCNLFCGQIILLLLNSVTLLFVLNPIASFSKRHLIFKCKPLPVFQNSQILSSELTCMYLSGRLASEHKTNQASRQKLGSKQLTHVECFEVVECFVDSFPTVFERHL